MQYVDGFVLPIPKKKVDAYVAIAKKAGKIWKEYGALEYRECVGEQLEIEGLVPFTKLARTKPDETVIFAFIVYKSRAQRDRIVAKIMKDPRLEAMNTPEMPFDMKRMACGGFKTVVKY
jgi:uncharacterized protein YbaA (DUF1428 family)